MFRVKEFQFRSLPSTAQPQDNHKSEDPNSQDCDNGELLLKDVLRSPEAGASRTVESVWNIDGELVNKSNLHVK